MRQSKRKNKTQERKRVVVPPATHRPAAVLGPLPMVVCTLSLLVCGLLHGLWMGRWGVTDECARAASRLENVPLIIGEWAGEDQEMDAREMRASGAAGYLSRRYVNQLTGDVISILLVCGPSGPVAVHPPDVCYTGSGFQLTANPVQHEIDSTPDSEPARFWTGFFTKSDATDPGGLRIFWSWSATGVWDAPEHPRMDYARHKALFKLYVVRATISDADPRENNLAEEFMRLFLDGTNRALFTSSHTGA